uniref:Ribosomal protein S2 n=1 Tax=Nitzschia sp. PL3-2 TaxID=2083271 RepID=A0A2Z5ZAQ4_9STRA|nr:ribosomal protein S2 [Nitzschia sp. PL3-2]
MKKNFLHFLKTKMYLGYPSRFWNPKMISFMYSKNKNYYIIDFYKFVLYLNKTIQYLKKITKKKKKVLFVGTSKKLKNFIAAEAKRSDSYFVNYRWLGGLLTNWPTIKSQIDYLNYLENLEKNRSYENLTKKEIYIQRKKLIQLRRDFEGLKKMTKLPDVAIILDQKTDMTAILECKKLNIPIISILDSNDNPDLIDFPLPANLQSLQVIKFILKTLSNSIRKEEKEYSNRAFKK